MIRELCRQSFNNESSENKTITNIRISDFDQYSSLEKREEKDGNWGLNHNDVVITFHGKDSSHQIKRSNQIENEIVLL